MQAYVGCKGPVACFFPRLWYNPHTSELILQDDFQSTRPVMTQSSPNDPRTLGLPSLAHRCAQETDLFFRREAYDPAYCFELFRRAIVTGDQNAHERLYVQYQSLVAGWVERHPSYSSTGEEVQYFVNRAFEKLWRALTPTKFGQFNDLKALLAYLKMCTHSAIVDFSRSHQHVISDDEPSQELIASGPGSGGDVEDDAVQQAQRSDFWRLIEERISGEKERAVIYGSFVHAMKPAELHSHYAHLFSDVKDVYRTKQNVIERLRRDETLTSYLSSQV